GRGPDMSKDVRLKIDLHGRSFQGDAKDVNTARQTSPMLAVLDRVGKTAEDAHLLGQFKLEVVHVAECAQAIRLEWNRDQVEVPLHAADEPGRQCMRLSRCGIQRRLAAVVDG